MELTCWHCRAVFDPEVTGKQCPNCGHYPEAWLAKLRFAAVDFIGPAFLVGMALYRFHEDVIFSTLFIMGSLVWAGFILYEDVSDWVPVTGVSSSKPPMPDSWKGLASMHGPRQLESGSISDTGTPKKGWAARASGLTGAEQFFIAILACALIAYAALHWNKFQSPLSLTKIPVTFLTYVAVIGGLIAYAVRRTSFEEQVLREGVLTTGVLAGWYDKSSYTRSGYHVYIRIRYYFWTESGQKFEGSGMLNPGLSTDSLSINQEPLKVFYLPQDPGKSVALCCTTSRV